MPSIPLLSNRQIACVDYLAQVCYETDVTIWEIGDIHEDFDKEEFTAKYEKLINIYITEVKYVRNKYIRLFRNIIKNGVQRIEDHIAEIPTDAADVSARIVAVISPLLNQRQQHTLITYEKFKRELDKVTKRNLDKIKAAISSRD